MGRTDADGTADPCTGYELMNDLDFDTGRSGSVDSNDDYPNWNPSVILAICSPLPFKAMVTPSLI